MPPKRKKRKKTKRTGAGWGKKVLLGVAGIGSAALAIGGYQLSQTGAGKWLSNRPKYRH